MDAFVFFSEFEESVAIGTVNVFHPLKYCLKESGIITSYLTLPIKNEIIKKNAEEQE